MSEKFKLDRKIGFQNMLYTKSINVIIESIGPSIILRSLCLTLLTFFINIWMGVGLVISIILSISIPLQWSNQTGQPRCQILFFINDNIINKQRTVVQTKSDSDAILCLQLLSKTFTCTPHLN